jgi:hypothetical protein
MDFKKVDAIQNWPKFKNVTKVQKLLEFANFYRRFIKKYSELVMLLINLIKKDVKFY